MSWLEALAGTACALCVVLVVCAIALFLAFQVRR